MDGASRRASEATDLDDAAYYRTIKSLVADGYLEAEVIETMSGYGEAIVVGLQPRGRRAVGQWPSDSADALLRALDRIIEVETDPVKQSAARRLRDAAGGFVRDVGAQTLGTILGQAGGMGLL